MRIRNRNLCYIAASATKYRTKVSKVNLKIAYASELQSILMNLVNILNFTKPFRYWNFKLFIARKFLKMEKFQY
ncbi:unnamed protein product [Larinioides sclopetarius]|uniref:Ribosomal protein L20 n=1 Tax=Larinioides sclopetarius TaxID=280406 RepID=A0AAV2A856_9ARAC